MVLLEMVGMEIDPFPPSPSLTVALGLDALSFSSQRIKFDPQRVLGVGKLFGKISSITPKREVVGLCT